MPEADADLLQGARHGDQRALHELVDRHAQRLFGLACSLVGNAEDAEDVVQETFLGALKGIRSFRGLSSVGTWLTSILLKQAARHHRGRARRWTLPLEGGPEASEARPDRRGHGLAGQSMDVRMDVTAALAGLSAEHREVVVLREFQGMSYAEMAEVLDVPLGTVESRLFRARQELKERLKGYLA